MSDHITELYDKDGTLIGALLSGPAWTRTRSAVLEALGLRDAAEPAHGPEPLAEWETLTQYWDFAYPVDTDVHCEHCGNSTQDWRGDEPRKFRLTSANLAGLVSFVCANCRAKVTKKHFKDKIKTECTPFTPEKNSSKEGRY
ncbi:hypothetical protein GKC30_08240 [Pseudodesulfovibrio sp. F-1]|uniref:Uncharacterized protein n=1 Tax=Pseudodesulfovibrio alkaliphilus TaxID=2661613 RepID=A0A7K1KNF9_9BACT|nr:hypothetical protein [Pseudodesulfovibrio alkaliphilus]MUM77619.1 hypothetical protein [Pseudodesulfovibrio alkaliphilus]